MLPGLRETHGHGALTEHEPSHALVLAGFLLSGEIPYKWLSQPIIKIRAATSWFKEVQLNGGYNLLLSEALKNE